MLALNEATGAAVLTLTVLVVLLLPPDPVTVSVTV